MQGFNVSVCPFRLLYFTRFDIKESNIYCSTKCYKRLYYLKIIFKISALIHANHFQISFYSQDVKTESHASFPALRMNNFQTLVATLNCIVHPLAHLTVHCKSRFLPDLSAWTDQGEYPAIHAAAYYWSRAAPDFSVKRVVRHGP